MLEQALMVLAASGGTAVVTAAGTEAWIGFRRQVAKIFGRGDEQREQAELERLDQTATALDVLEPAEVERVQIRQEASWQARFETLLENLTGDERNQVVSELRALLRDQAAIAASASVGDVAAGGDVNIHAEGGSIAAAVIHGGASIGTPHRPDSPQG
ncbi:hypothetical protein PL81_26955 [Streptomyces sp. RSD-27]|nr:hypothetical protein PL81_26955 [Streptomyces sp. RSD-27]